MRKKKSEIEVELQAACRAYDRAYEAWRAAEQRLDTAIARKRGSSR